MKSATKTLLFLQDNGITEFDKLQEKAQQAKDNFNDISDGIKAADKRLQDISTLQKHIGTYSKTREIYAEYRKGGFSKKYLSQHSDDIAKHKTAKKYFDELGLKKLPTIETLQTEYATVSAEKKKLYSQYHEARKFMQDILTAEQNAKQISNYKDTSPERKNEGTEI